MRCLYCDSFITDYPTDGICPNCGGKLPEPKPVFDRRCPGCGILSSGNFCHKCGTPLNAPTPQSVVRPIVQPVYVQPVYQPVRPVAAVPGVNCCPKCKGLQLTYEKRGFSWGWGIFGFFMIPVFGLLLGFCGRNKQKYLRCNTCRPKWKRR